MSLKSFGIEIKINLGIDELTGSQLLEVYSVEMQFCALTNAYRRMKEIYPKTVQLSSAIADPRNVAVIRECAGKYLLMREKRWELAYNEFFEAFQNYQETGNSKKAKQILKYAVLANMLAGSHINPFDSREGKIFLEEPDMAAMVETLKIDRFRMNQV